MLLTLSALLALSILLPFSCPATGTVIDSAWTYSCELSNETNCEPLGRIVQPSICTRNCWWLPPIPRGVEYILVFVLGEPGVAKFSHDLPTDYTKTLQLEFQIMILHPGSQNNLLVLDVGAREIFNTSVGNYTGWSKMNLTAKLDYSRRSTEVSFSYRINGDGSYLGYTYILVTAPEYSFPTPSYQLEFILILIVGIIWVGFILIFLAIRTWRALRPSRIGYVRVN